MNVIPTDLPGVLILEPKVFGDERGLFFESHNRRAFHKATGIDVEFVQDNHSRSKKDVLRGLHYQVRQAQGKLVRVIAGEVWDVAVDLRRSAGEVGQCLSSALSAIHTRLACIPPRYAHDVLVDSDTAALLDNTTDYCAAEHERPLLWNDQALGIDWPLAGAPILADKDRRGALLAAAEVFP